MKKIRLLISITLFLAVITVGIAPMMWPSSVKAEGSICNLGRGGVRENPWDPCPASLCDPIG